MGHAQLQGIAFGAQHLMATACGLLLDSRLCPAESSTLETRPMARSNQPSVPSEIWAFLRERKKWWLGPIILVLVLFGGLLVLAQGSAVAPFIYTIF
jgi:hypothetical protein